MKLVFTSRPWVPISTRPRELNCCIDWPYFIFIMMFIVLREAASKVQGTFLIFFSMSFSMPEFAGFKNIYIIYVIIKDWQLGGGGLRP